MRFECKLRVILAEIPLKQKELVAAMEKAGYKLSAAALSQLVGGKTQPEFETAYAIAKTLRTWRPGIQIEDIWVEK